MLNILKGVKFAQDDSTGDVYAVDCVDGPKKLTGGGGGGSGFEYDFIIKTDGETYTLATGTYEAINAKLGKQPVNGKILMFSGDGYNADMDCILVLNNRERLLVGAFMGDAIVSLVISADNTVALT